MIRKGENFRERKEKLRMGEARNRPIEKKEKVRSIREEREKRETPLILRRQRNDHDIEGKAPPVADREKREHLGFQKVSEGNTPLSSRKKKKNIRRALHKRGEGDKIAQISNGCWRQAKQIPEERNGIDADQREKKGKPICRELRGGKRSELHPRLCGETHGSYRGGNKNSPA